MTIISEASSLTKKVGQEKLAEVYGSSPYSIEVKAESEVSNKWRLSLDPEMNCALRDEFYFEQVLSTLWLLSAFIMLGDKISLLYSIFSPLNKCPHKILIV